MYVYFHVRVLVLAEVHDKYRLTDERGDGAFVDVLAARKYTGVKWK